MVSTYQYPTLQLSNAFSVVCKTAAWERKLGNPPPTYLTCGPVLCFFAKKNLDSENRQCDD